MGLDSPVLLRMALVGIIGLSVTASLPARGEPALATAPLPRAAPTPDELRAAARKFAEGEKAFRTGDFTRAGDSFDAAYQLAPHEDALWNAANAWQRAGELVRAANLYARYLREAPPGARDRSSATTALTTLAPKLGKLDVFAPASDAVTVDDQVVEGRSLYVSPGVHVVRARRGDRDQVQTAVVGIGQLLSVAFAEESEKSAPPASREQPQTMATMAPPLRSPVPTPRSGGLSGWVVVVEAAITTGIGAWTIGSAIDTRRARTAFYEAPSDAALEAGRAKQTRTNVLLGVTGGLAVLTAITAIWLVEWHPTTSEVRVGVGALPGLPASLGPAGAPVAAVASGRF